MSNKKRKDQLNEKDQEVLEHNVDQMQEQIDRKQQGADEETDEENVIHPPDEASQSGDSSPTPNDESLPSGGTTGGLIRGKHGRRS